jgi:glycosyltransferase involved in cell wall biosynthesis
MMKLLYLLNQRFPTEKAYGIQIAKTCEALADLGVDTTLVIAFKTDDIKKDFFEYYSIKRNIKYKNIFYSDFYLPGRIAFLIKNYISAVVLTVYTLFQRFDIVYSRDEVIIFLLSFVTRPQNLVFEAHSFSDSRGFLYRRIRNKSIKVAVISHGLRDVFIKFGFKAENILVASDGVSIDEFNINETKEECRIKLDLPNDKKIIMYSGHLFDWKGVHVLANTADYLPEEYFVFVGGTGDDVSKFKKQYGNRENVRIIGHRPHGEIPLFLKAADVLVIPNSAKEKMSAFYTSPLKLFEYMASRKPIVASDLSSIREVLNDGNSILVKPDDVDALANGIRLALDDSVLSERISSSAYECVNQYTWKKRSEKIINFLTFK